jgi:hypothetical protein
VVFGMLLTPSVRATMTAARPFGVATVDPQPPASNGECGDGKVRCLEPILYAIDTVVPLIDLGQRSTWYPSGHDGAQFQPCSTCPRYLAGLPPPSLRFRSPA